MGVVDVLFAANSFDDLVTQLNLMERLGNSDVDTVKSIAAYQQDIKDRRVKLDADKKAAAKLVDEARRAEDRGRRAREQAREDDRRHQGGHPAPPGAAGRRRASRRGRPPQQNTGGERRAAEAAAPSSTPAAPVIPSVVGIAQRYLGVPYVYGGASPSGFDCSGLTMYCYAQVGIGLAHGATDQQHASTPVPLSALQPGDLVFFGTASYSYHVGIYVGGGSMIHAPHTGAVVSYGSISGAWIGGRP